MSCKTEPRKNGSLGAVTNPSHQGFRFIEQPQSFPQEDGFFFLQHKRQMKTTKVIPTIERAL